MVLLVRKWQILEMWQRSRWQNLAIDWMCGLEERSKSRITPSTLACVAGPMVVPLILMVKSWGGDRGGGNITRSVLERLSLRKRCDNHTDM